MRLIDADRFKEFITLDDDDLGLFKTEKQKQLTISIMEAFLKDIDEQPTIDAVEVVRCKDCKHWVRDGNDSFGYAMFCKANCSLGGQGIKKPDDFCSYGERKGDG